MRRAAMFLFPFLWVLFPWPAMAQSVPDEEVLRQAVAAFQQGVRARETPAEAALFRQAAVSFEELCQRGAWNAALFWNEGNAYLLAGDLPQAILAYRRGLRLAPNDRALRANLAYARHQVVYASPGNFGRPPGSAWPGWLPRFAPAAFGLLALFFYSWLCLAITRWWMTRQHWLVISSAATFALAALCAFALAVQQRNERRQASHPLVVIAVDGVMLRQGNGWSYPVNHDTPLHRGVEARLRFARGQWFQIELAGGEVGWVPRGSVLVDLP